jgi:Glyoxalase/Bleomycin resistance protein/Dioxygenase superfamily
MTMGGRIDHFIWVVESENVERYVALFSDLFGIEFDHMDGPALGPWPVGRGIHAYVAWEAGLEVVAPIHDEDPLAARFMDHLRRHGEGPFGIAFGVGSLEDAVQRAADHGFEPGAPLQVGGDADRQARLATWTSRVTDVREAFIGEVLATNLLLAEVTYPPEPSGA